ncbi:hypothetical protein AB1339_37435, partial [Streptomyces cyaneofuscatus]
GPGGHATEIGDSAYLRDPSSGRTRPPKPPRPEAGPGQPGQPGQGKKPDDKGDQGSDEASGESPDEE